MTDLVTHAAAADAKSLTARSGEPAPLAVRPICSSTTTRTFIGDSASSIAARAFGGCVMSVAGSRSR
jgi:hypothetical protein